MRRLFRIGMATALGVLGLTAASQPANAVPEAPSAEAQFFTLLNDARQTEGLKPLVRDHGLDAVALEWSGHMSATFAHSGIVIRPGVKEHAVPADCDVDALCHRPNLAEAVASVEPSWRAAGENVGTGGEVPSLHNAFMASPGHHANIVGDYNRVGVGVVISGSTIWVTFNFLRGPDLAGGTAPLRDNGAHKVTPTATPNVTPLGASAKLVPLAPRRVLDTRDAGVAVPAGGEVVVDLSAQSDKPADATAAALNVTATDTAGNGYLTVHPCSVARPLASSVNYAAGRTVPNNVTVALGSTGKVCIYTQVAAHIVVDLDGWYSPTAPGGAGLETVTPSRLLDSRNSGGRNQSFTVALGAVVPASASAVTLNVTVTDPLFSGYLTVYPCGSPVPLASNLNFAPGQTVPNLVTVKIGEGRSVCLYANSPTNVVVDLDGDFTAAGRAVRAVNPSRLLDTRDGSGGWLGALSAGQSIDLPVAGVAGIPADAAGVLLNVTVADAAAAGYVTVYPCGSDRPLASNLNYAAGQTTSNAVAVKLGTGSVCLFSTQSVDLIADVAGYVR